MRGWAASRCGGIFPRRWSAATGCGVFAFSRFGYGGSDPVTLPRPMSYMHDEALTVLPLVLDAVGLQRAVLIGHSDGGSIAAIHAGAVQRSARVWPGADRGALLRRGDQHRQHRRDQGNLRGGRSALCGWRAIIATSMWRSAVGTTPGSIRGSVRSTSRSMSRASRCRCWRCRAPRIHTAPRSSFGCWNAWRTAPVETRLIAGPRHAPHLEAREATLDSDRTVRSGSVLMRGSGMKRIDFQTDPASYRHWRLAFDGPVATLTMDVDPSCGLFGAAS